MDPALRLTLRQGTVYFMVHRSVNEIPHYFIVCNSAPLQAQVIVLSVVTSQVDKRKNFALRQGESPETIVDLSPDDFPELTKPSCVDCNTVKVCEFSQFVEDIKCNVIRNCADVPPAIMERIKRGISMSKRVDGFVKALVAAPLAGSEGI